jgi:adenosylcobinamide kinase/adenosylcobinamide-phosphate guanylyltransferase
MSDARSTLVLGGVRSGKSRFAQQLAMQSGLRVVYVATATAQDEEMRARIARHQADRPMGWATVESPLALADTLQQYAAADRCLIVDCLTLWLTNLLLHEDRTRLERERIALLTCVDRVPGRLILVGNETGLGVVPTGELTRRYCDEAGWLHQALAARCERVVFCVAGLPMTLKGDANG